MSQPPQPIAVLVSADEKVSQQIRLVLARQSLAIRYEFAGIRQALERLPLEQMEGTYFFCVARSPEDIYDMERLSNAFAGCPLAAILACPHGDRAVVEAMRAGAAQVVPFPVEEDDLNAAVKRLLVQFGHLHGDVRTIAVSGVHGGVGATTIALNLAYEIATSQDLALRCLIAESSRAAGTLSSFLGLNPRYTTTDLLKIGEEADHNVLKGCLTEIAPRLYLLPAARAGQERIATDAEYRLLLRLLPQLVDIAVLDFNYANDEPILQRIAECQHYLLVGKHSVISLDALKAVRDLFVGKFPQTKPMLLINAYDPANKKLSIAVLEKLFGGPVYTVRADTDAMKRAREAGEFLPMIAPGSVAWDDIRALARAVLNLPVETSKQRGLFDFLYEWFRSS